jgi:hypothetical protein
MAPHISRRLSTQSSDKRRKIGTFNLSLILRKLLGADTPREMKNRAASLMLRLLRSLAGISIYGQ